MLAVLGVPQLLSSYFDLRARRLDRLENEANAERRHRELLEERRHEEERRRQEAELADRRHLELIATILASTGNRDRDDTQAELIRNLQQTVANLEAENAKLRQQNDNSETSS